METKLLCCPLCDQETPYPPTTSGPGMWVIMCSHCFLRVSDNTKAKVILKWNTRAPSPYKSLCDELARVLRKYAGAYPAFRLKPIGALGSEKRLEQDLLMALEDLGKDVLAKYESMKGDV